MKQHVTAITGGYSEIFFLNRPWMGLLIMVLTLFNPNVALAGAVAAIAAYAFAHFIHMNKAFLESGFYIYNPLLVGLSIGYLFRITPLTLFFVITAGIFAFMMTHMMYSILSYYLRLPILSVPFVMVSSLAYLASTKYSNLLVTAIYPSYLSSVELHLPFWLTGLFKSLGAILFVPNMVAGAFLLLVILLYSRILFVLMILGYYTGTLITALMVGSVHQAFASINHFNYIWIAMAIGGVYLIPSVKSYILALIAVATSTIVLSSTEVFWATYGIPAFALPFNMVSLAFIYVLGITGFPLMTRVIKSSPEESLDYYLSTTLRFKGTERTLSMPFSGKWTVWQGFNGQWTHQGSWKHAYDFVITDDEAETHKNGGTLLEDYYAYKKPVLSPIRGRVVKAIDSLQDNPVGEVDQSNNWGNLVVIYDPRGFWVELSHFHRESIKVEEGQWVERGALLGLCGNSGYSPQPHIHVQVQAAETIGAATLSFSFVGYVQENRFFANDLPEETAVIESLQEDRALGIKMNPILDQQYHYEVFRSDQKVTDITWTVKMALDGTFYFDSGKGRLYFGKQEGTYYVYSIEGNDPYLKALFMALPRLPLAYRDHLSWEDYIPVGTVCKGVCKATALFLSSFCHNLNKIHVSCTYEDRQTIRGEVVSTFLRYQGKTLVELDERVGLKRIRLDDLELRLRQKD
jgi:urea transporter/murein DD-endopeptidase MepM/ murein hydrolase activator NlpD